MKRETIPLLLKKFYIGYLKLKSFASGYQALAQQLEFSEKDIIAEFKPNILNAVVM